MDAEKTDGIVIRLADFSNTSRVVTFFTRSLGKVSTIAKGGKRLKGPFDTGLDLLSESRLVFLRKSNALDILTEASLTLRFRPNSANVGCFYAGCYVADLLSSLTEEDDPHPQLFETAQWALRQLMQQADYRLIVLRFELAILREIGHLPALDECLQCGCSTVGCDSIATSNQPSGNFSYWVTQGGLLCPCCQSDEYSSHTIQAGSVALMRQLLADPTTQTQHITATPRQVQEVRHTLTSSIASVLGYRPKTLRFLQF